MQYQDYYQTLGVSRQADEAEIKKAYRKLAGKYHPDKPTGDEAKFKDINEAYEVLSDSEKRRMFDQLGANYQNGQNVQPPPGSGGGFSNGGGDFSDFFEQMFAGGMGQQQGGFGGRSAGFQRAGEDLNVKVLVSLEDAINGAEKTLNLSIPKAGLHGQVRHESKQLKVKIPVGVKQGSRIRLSGQGAEGSGGGAKGNLIIEIDLQSHPLYKVEEEDVLLNLPLTPWEAALGTKVEVPTLKGKVNMNISPGTQSGAKLRIKGRGLGKGSAVGDQYIVVQIHTPPVISDEIKIFYEKMAEVLPFNPREHF